MQNMFTERQVRDLMVNVEQYPAVTSDATFREVAAALKRSCPQAGGDVQTRAVLVYENNLLTGLVSLEDLMRAIEPQYLKGGTYRGWTVDAAWAIPVFWEGLFTERCLDAAERRVREIMRPVDFCVNADDPLIKAVYGMGKYQTNILPVVEEERVIGMIRSIEIFQEITSIILADESKVYEMERLFTARQSSIGVPKTAQHR
ncbi:MAG: CBS domain-containing protein [Desulfurispora sp.]|uniref:CBS domain-containing protein n=1 Tax=Desulfurispora sp. TaxID=3014275 RepID=UPI00404B6F84